MDISASSAIATALPATHFQILGDFTLLRAFELVVADELLLELRRIQDP